MSATKIPFESNEERQVGQIRLDDRREAQLGTPAAYRGPDGEALAVRGTAEGPYALAVGRASTTGVLPADGSDGGVVQTGQSQRVLVDEYGRLWVRAVPEPPVQIVGLRYATGDTAENQTPAILPGAQVLRVRVANVSLAGGVAAGRVLMLFDAAGAVVDGAVPLWRGVILDAGAGYFNQVEVGFPEIDGLIFAAGLVAALSTTLDVLTLPVSPEGFFGLTYTLE